MGARPGRIALVVEGGAMRGIFSAGVLDVFLEQRFRPFDLALGVSVGASNILSYLAGQHGRARRCFLGQMSRPEFIDPWRMLRGGHWLDLDWLWEAITREDPLDCHAAAASGVEYALVATCATTGDPRYLSPGADDMLAALKASCALPFLYRGVVRVGLDSLVDGGISDPVPVREAYRRRGTHDRGRAIARSGLREEGPPGQPRRRVDDAGIARHRAGRAARPRRPTATPWPIFLASPPEDCRVIQIAPVGVARDEPDVPGPRGHGARLPPSGGALGRQAIAEFASETPPRAARSAPSASTQPLAPPADGSREKGGSPMTTTHPDRLDRPSSGAPRSALRDRALALLAGPSSSTLRTSSARWCTSTREDERGWLALGVQCDEAIDRSTTSRWTALLRGRRDGVGTPAVMRAGAGADPPAAPGVTATRARRSSKRRASPTASCGTTSSSAWSRSSERIAEAAKGACGLAGPARALRA